MSSSTGFAICCFALLLGSTAGNMVSPGLQKCLDIMAEKKDDGSRETVEDMEKKDSVNVQLYKCHHKTNQDWEIIDGQIKSEALDDRCLTVEGEAKKNANVHLAKCGGDNQKWDFTGKSYIQLQGTELCLDVKAKKLDDDTYEKFDQIKKHKTVNVQLYTCHDPKTTRVNQLWEFAPYSGNHVISAWELPSNSILKSNTSGIGSMALATAGMACLFAAGVFIGLRKRKSTVQQPMAQLELE